MTGVADLRLRILPYAVEHGVHLFDLPTHHADPFDRQIISQALPTLKGIGIDPNIRETRSFFNVGNVGNVGNA